MRRTQIYFTRANKPSYAWALCVDCGLGAGGQKRSEGFVKAPREVNLQALHTGRATKFGKPEDFLLWEFFRSATMLVSNLFQWTLESPLGMANGHDISVTYHHFEKQQSSLCNKYKYIFVELIVFYQWISCNWAFSLLNCDPEHFQQLCCLYFQLRDTFHYFIITKSYCRIDNIFKLWQ